MNTKPQILFLSHGGGPMPLLGDVGHKEMIDCLQKISSILPVHIAGHLCKMDEIMDISRKYDIPVVEDAAHAFPVCDNGKYAGTYGEAGVFSFYATKTITTGEGGMVVTSSDRIARHMKKMRLHGIDKTSWDRNKSNDNQ